MSSAAGDRAIGLVRRPGDDPDRGIACIAVCGAPGTRANIDEFTRATARGLEIVGGGARGKAIIVLNPAEPPVIMRNTVFVLSDLADEREVARSASAECL